MTARTHTTRRRLLQGAGAVTLLAAGGVVWRGVDRGAFTTVQGPAYAPWKLYGTADLQGTPEAVAAAGTLASNAHNTQPWIFRVDGEEITLYADLSRNLGAFDPFLREMHLSLGCALENMVQAAPAHGFAVRVLPEGGDLQSLSAREGRRMVARVRLTADPKARATPLSDAIIGRHTNRGPYDHARPVPPELRAALAKPYPDFSDISVHWFDDAEPRQRFDRLTVTATERIIADTRMVQDSDAWFRLTQDEINEHRDGPTIDAAGLSAPVRIAAKWLPPLPPEQTHATWLSSTRDIHLATAPLAGIIAVNNLYDVHQTLDAGRQWQRMHLTATAAGLAMQPLNQTVEVVDREAQLGQPDRMAEELATLIGTRRARPTFVFRAGYPARQAIPSPRRSFEDVIAG
ncbi:MAG: Acg family FMN-binding oxidoreductase [Alphaproteobacteria bacterium]